MTKVIVYHRYYGCDTGCCGHAVTFGEPDDDTEECFKFTHRYNRETREEFVRRIVTETVGAEHVADIDWENCVILDD